MYIKDDIKSEPMEAQTDVVEAFKASSKRPKLSTKQFYFISFYLTSIKLLCT